MLDAASFTKGCRLIDKAIRTRADASWDPEDFTLKFASFSSEFPEVNSRQFLWCCECWIQAQGDGFLRFPSWKQLMAFLYRTENGLANRSWGPKPDLPPLAQFSADQRRLLPAAARSVLPPPDPANAEAYAVVGRGAVEGPLLPEAPGRFLTHAEASALTEELWQQHLSQRPDGDDDPKPEANPGAGPPTGPVVRYPVQQGRQGASPAHP